MRAASMAALPPPTTTTLRPTGAEPRMLYSRRKRMASVTPFSVLARHAQVRALRRADAQEHRLVALVAQALEREILARGAFRSRWPRPGARSCAPRARGPRAAGGTPEWSARACRPGAIRPRTPSAGSPGGRGNRRSDRPAGPAPTMAILRLAFVSLSRTSGSWIVTSCSTMNRFTPRMDSASSSGAAAALVLAGVEADARADRGERVALAVQAQRLGVALLADQRRRSPARRPSPGRRSGRGRAPAPGTRRPGSACRGCAPRTRRGNGGSWRAPGSAPSGPGRRAPCP